MSAEPLRLGTRGSTLAMAQAAAVADAIGGVEIVPVKTDDSAVGDKARFVRAIETALLDERIDIAVHSAKDLPGELPEGLAIAGVPRREDPADAWVGHAASLDEVSEGARIGTSSLRRRSQLLALRPDLEPAELRGNVDTRLAKLESGVVDGLLLAVAGLHRLGRAAEIAFRFETAELTPSPGQGTLALETRDGDQRAREAASALTDPGALAELTAERAAVTELGASCDTPVGVLARVEGQSLKLTGYAGLPDGSEWVRDEITRELSDPAAAGVELAKRMAAAGATEILEKAEALA